MVDCELGISKFETQPYCYVHFLLTAQEKGINILPSYESVLPTLFFCKYSFGIKYPTKVDMPLNKETKQSLSFP